MKFIIHKQLLYPFLLSLLPKQRTDPDFTGSVNAYFNFPRTTSYMQSEPIEISKQLTTTTQSAVHEATQHGTQPLDLHATDNAVEKQGVSIFSTLDDTIGGADHHADNTTRFRQLQIGEHDSSHRPSYQRITEYENASLPVTPRVEDEGPAFKIVKSRSPQPGGPHVDNFPNGMGNSRSIFSNTTNNPQRF